MNESFEVRTAKVDIVQEWPTVKRPLSSSFRYSLCGQLIPAAYLKPQTACSKILVGTLNSATRVEVAAANHERDEKYHYRGQRMQKEILLEILKQNQFTSHFSLDRVSEENASLRLNGKTASIGFIYRHIGETMNLFGALWGVRTDVKNTTIGQTDTGQGLMSNSAGS